MAMLAVAGCGTIDASNRPQPDAARPGPMTFRPIAPSTSQDTPFPAFVTAANTGDTAAVAALFVPDARFDSVGRIYQGRGQIMDRFLIPEVIELRGHYEVVRIRTIRPGRAVGEFQFATDGGGREHFTYDCHITNGRFTDCVGRYA